MEETITYHTCSKCGEEKPLTSEYFYKRNTKFGWNKECKICKSNKNKIYREKNPEYYKKYGKEYREKNKNEIRKYIREYMKKYRGDNEKHKKYQREYMKKYMYNEKCKNVRNDSRKKRYNNDILFKLKVIIRNSINRRITNKSKSTTSEKILGCSIEDFKIYIENKFTEGMSWDNYGMFGWHLDHIIPLSSAKTEEDVYRLNHYTNFQPLWAEENMEKSNKII